MLFKHEMHYDYVNTFANANLVERGVHFVALYASLGCNYPVMSIGKIYPPIFGADF